MGSPFDLKGTFEASLFFCLMANSPLSACIYAWQLYGVVVVYKNACKASPPVLYPRLFLLSPNTSESYRKQPYSALQENVAI